MSLIFDQCPLQANNVPELVKHLLAVHNKENMFCPFCEFATKEQDLMTAHMNDYHDQLAILNSIGTQLSQFRDNFSNLEVFKEELTVVLNKVIDSHNTLRKELFLIRNHLNVKNESVSANVPAQPKPT
jgi:hypothetical protein